jgi:hypothetical protein
MSGTQTITINDVFYTIATKLAVFGTGQGQIAWSSIGNAHNLLGQINSKSNISKLSGVEVDFSSGLTQEVEEINLAILLDDEITTAFIDIEYSWDGPGNNSDFTIEIPKTVGETIIINRNATATAKREMLTIPVGHYMGTIFNIHGNADYFINLKIKIKIIGYL